MRYKYFCPKIIICIFLSIMHWNSEPYSRPSRNTLSRVISRNHVTVFIGHHIIKVHRYLITPNTITINKLCTLNLELFNITVWRFSNHFNCTFACRKFIHSTHLVCWYALLWYAIWRIVSNKASHEHTGRLKFEIYINICSCDSNCFSKFRISPKWYNINNCILPKNLT